MTTPGYLKSKDVTGRYIHDSKGNQIELVELIDSRNDFISKINPKKFETPQQLLEHIIDQLK